jgi:glucosamine-6-phosphate deaminase
LKIEIFAQPQQVSQRAAEILIETVVDKPDCILGLATGQTQINVYRHVVTAFQQGRVSFARARCFNLDEYVGLSPEHPNSYRAYMEQHLFNKVDLRPEHIGFLQGNAENLLQECERYEQLLQAHAPRDLQILGLGRDGHIGFNEPGTPFDSLTHVQDLDPRTLADNQKNFSPPESMPRQALTMGIQSLLEAHAIVLVAFGESKRWAVKEMVQGPVGTHLPATVLRQHRNVQILLDKSAAQDLT